MFLMLKQHIFELAFEYHAMSIEPGVGAVLYEIHHRISCLQQASKWGVKLPMIIGMHSVTDAICLPAQLLL